ncbi:MAG: DUF308 domain-containing protein [Rikenellaceae bacterium]
MKKFNLLEQLPRAIVSIIIGLLLVIFPEVFQNTIIYLIGGIVVLLGLMKLISYFIVKQQNPDIPLPIKAIIYLFIGVILCLKADVFLGILMFSLGFILFFIGLGQVLMYVSTKAPLTMYVFPMIILIAGFVSIRNPFEVTQTLISFFGYVILFYAISELISLYINNYRNLE